jgi:hypothetical protein
MCCGAEYSGEHFSYRPFHLPSPHFSPGGDAWFPSSAWEPTCAKLCFARRKQSFHTCRSQAELGSEVASRALHVVRNAG